MEYREIKIWVEGSERFVNDIKDLLGPVGYQVLSGWLEVSMLEAGGKNSINVALIEDRSSESEAVKNIIASRVPVIMFTACRLTKDILEIKRQGVEDIIGIPYNAREVIARVNSIIFKKRRITCLGGGTGLFHILLGLKTIPNVLLTSIVSMTDDGGSSGRLKASFGILPPGDIRRSLVALSNAPEVMNQLMQYRFHRGEGIEGHNLGNLFLTALTDMTGTLPEAVRSISDILNVQGIVLPVTDMSGEICAEFFDGRIIKGESRIDKCEEREPDLRIKDIWHEPELECNFDAFSAIMNSDIVVMGPGDLFTSVITNLKIKGITDALEKTTAKKIYMCNLMTKPGETSGYNAFDHVNDLVRALERDCLDYIVVSDTNLPDDAVNEYAAMNQVPVKPVDLERIRGISKAEIILFDAGHEKELVRHDSEKVCRLMEEILQRTYA